MTGDRQSQPWELSGCAGKTGYGSKADALACIGHREKAGRARQRGSGKMHPYRCRFCHQWHIGAGV